MSWSGYIPGDLMNNIINDPEKLERFLAIMRGEEVPDVRTRIPEDSDPLEETA